MPQISSLFWLRYTARNVLLTGLYARPIPSPPPLTASGSEVLPTDAAFPSASRPRSIQALPLYPHVIVRYWFVLELYATSGY